MGSINMDIGFCVDLNIRWLLLKVFWLGRPVVDVIIVLEVWVVEGSVVVVVVVVESVEELEEEEEVVVVEDGVDEENEVYGE